eukprot:3006506-Amphidinium_carterae.1
MLQPSWSFLLVSRSPRYWLHPSMLSPLWVWLSASRLPLPLTSLCAARSEHSRLTRTHYGGSCTR